MPFLRKRNRWSRPPLSLKIPLRWSCGQVPSASGFGETPGLDCTPAAADEKRTLETFTPPTRATLTPEATPKRLTEEATDSTDEDCWTHGPSWMQGPKMSMPPNTFTRLIRLRSSSSDSSDSTWDTVDEKSGVPSAGQSGTCRSTLAGTTTSSAQETCSPDIERQLQGSALLSTRSVLTSPFSETRQLPNDRRR